MKTISIMIFISAISLILLTKVIGFTNEITPMESGGSSSYYAQETNKPLFGGVCHYDRKLFITVKKTKNLIKKKQCVLVDTRRKDDYSSFKIPGSINIPAYAVKTKHFLSEVHVVLINEGYSYKGLVDICRQLQNRKIDAHILAGGLNYWQISGGALVGDPFYGKQLNEMDSKHLYAERNCNRWLFLDLSNFEQKYVNRLMPHAVKISPDKITDNIDSILGNTSEQIKNDPILSILVMDTDGINYQTVKYQINDQNQYNIYFLSGGINNYKVYIEKMAAMRRSKEERTVSRSGCSSCN